MRCASVLEDINKFDMGRKLLRMLGSRLGCFSMIIIACLYIDRTMSLLSDLLKISLSGWAISDATVSLVL